MEILKIENLSKSYQSGSIAVNALNDVSFNVEKGEFMSIVGPSGSGKTTLLNLIGGLDKPTNGNIIIDNVEIQNLSSNQAINFRLHNIGFVFQAYNLIPVLTAKENLEFIMRLKGIKKKERNDRSKELFNTLGLLGKEDRRPSQLSGGEQQRVAVARALASNPKYILADEPTANLDSKSTENLIRLMAQVCDKEKVTFIFSTHDQRVIKNARRVIVLEDGKIKSDGLAADKLVSEVSVLVN